ncbi:MAG: hypothetical protein WD014_04980 [Dongiaceae bacterium]
MKPKGSEERALLEYLEGIGAHRERGWAFHFHLSKLGTHSRGENLIYALGRIRSLAEGLLGRVFVLGSSDLVVVCKTVRLPAIKEEIRKIQYLFRDDPLIQLGSLGDADFCTIVNLTESFAEFLGLVRSLAAGASSPGAGPAPAAAGEGATLDLVQFAAIAGRLAASDLSWAVRFQPVYAVDEDMTLTRQFEELYVSIGDLERIVAPGRRLAADRWLFQHLTKTLDRQMLALLTSGKGVSLAAEALQSRFLRSGRFSLNLNVSTVLSPDFQAFEAGLDEAVRRSVVIELHKIDVFADLGSYLFVRDYAYQRGYRICLDGLSHVSLPFIDIGALAVDLLKLLWTPAMAIDVSSAERAVLQERIAQAGPQRLIVCHCDSDDAIAWGRGLGISLFQGRRLDAIAAERVAPAVIEVGPAAGILSA